VRTRTSTCRSLVLLAVFVGAQLLAIGQLYRCSMTEAIGLTPCDTACCQLPEVPVDSCCADADSVVTEVTATTSCCVAILDDVGDLVPLPADATVRVQWLVAVVRDNVQHARPARIPARAALLAAPRAPAVPTYLTQRSLLL
jgi:hypothetical protein